MLTSIAFCAIAVQVALPPDLRNVSRIVMLGDSITQGGDHPKGFVGLIRSGLAAAYKDHPIEVINAGIGGHKATDMSARFAKDVLDRKPDMVMISVGVNDVWHDFRTPDWTGRVPEGNSGRGVALDVFTLHLERMIGLAKEAGIRVVILSPTLVYEDLNCAENKRLSRYVDAGERLAKQTGVRYMNLNKPFRDAVAAYQRQTGPGSLLLTTDGVHLNDAGNALMANLILKNLGVPVPNNVAAK
jgi:lysophospholipase L1-like esterase